MKFPIGEKYFLKEFFTYVQEMLSKGPAILEEIGIIETGMRHNKLFNIVIYITFLCIILPSALTSQWKIINPLPTPDGIISLAFVDSLNGWISAGGSSVILHTTDGGETWSYQNIGIRQAFTDIVFLNKLTGWVLPERDSAIYHTTNGGLSWVRQSIGKHYFQKLQYFNNDSAIASETLGFYKTSNGGESWSKLNFKFPQHEIIDISFVSFDYGYVLVDSLYRTTDGGNTWKNIYKTGTAVYFLDTLNGWLAKESQILQTTDGGNTWTERQAGIVGVSFNNFSFPDRKNGWAFGHTSIFHSNDSGKTWNEQYSGQNLGEGQMLTEKIGFAGVELDGGILKTTNGGLTWTNLNHAVTRTMLRNIFVWNKDIFWICGGVYQLPNTGEIQKTTDGGMTWGKQLTDYPNIVTDVHFTSLETGWACGEGGTLLKSTNSGENWVLQDIGTTSNLYSIEFIDNMNGWIGGDGIIFRTTDGGINWTPYNLDTGFQAKKVTFTSTEIGWAIETNGAAGTSNLLFTTDGGTSWNTKFPENLLSLEDIFFIDTNNGWAVGDTIIHTTDAGVTWSGVNKLSLYTCSSVIFQNSLDGMLGFYSGAVQMTTDGGNTWIEDVTPTSRPILSLKYLTSGVGYAVGFAGLMMKNSSLPTEVKISKNPEIATDIDVLGNFPNPFNSSTIINFTITKPQILVDITIYDFLGRKVKTLVSKEISQGAYKVEWNGFGSDDKLVASGIYFYIVKTNNVSISKKMIFLK